MPPPCRRGDRAAAACVLLVVVVVVLTGFLSCAAARPAPVVVHRVHGGAALHSFKQQLLDARRGSRVTGLADLKRHLARFGYMPAGGHDHVDHPSDDVFFDEHLEVAVKRYQSRLSLPVTGRLDSATLDKIMSPRCGVEDHAVSPGPGHDDHAVVSRFTFVAEGKPPWSRRSSPIVVTYSFSPEATINYLPLADVRAVFQRAFARWARVIPVSFVETDDYDDADVKVGFYVGDHGDGDPFDGPLGDLAHASPLDGELHLDASERWVLSFGKGGAEDDSDAIDLESLATHEIGHILGLDHSTLPNAVMYPTIGTLEKKADLTLDDVQGAQQLYGSNPDFRISSLYDNPSENSMSPPARSSCWFATSGTVVVGIVLVILATRF